MAQTASWPKVVLAIALGWALATPALGGDDEPLPLKLSAVVPSFRTNSLGPEFFVSVVNAGAKPIQHARLANTVLIEASGIRYGRHPVFAHVVPPELAPGAEYQEWVAVGDFPVPLKAGENTITILIGGVRSAPVRFNWNPEPRRDCEPGGG